MAAPATLFRLTKQSEELLVTYLRNCQSYFVANYNIRERLIDIDRAYMREQDWTSEQQRAKLANRYGDASKFQNITVPVVMPQVEAAVSYQASVFLTGVPLFGVAASPIYEDAAMQMETVIDHQAIKGNWVPQFMQSFRNGIKYNVAATECSWERITTAAIETDKGFSDKEGKPVEIVWEGNRVKSLDMYNVIWDHRVDLTEVHSTGEFAGWNKIMGKIQLKQFIQKLKVDAAAGDLVTQNETKAFGTSANWNYYYIPQLNPDALLDRISTGVFNWAQWFNGPVSGNRKDAIQYGAAYIVTKMYVRLMPSDFGITAPRANTPQVWLFYMVNAQVIIYAERLTNAHDYIPILFSAPMDDGIAYQTKSFADNIIPIQQLTSTMVNSLVSSRRRALGDRLLYNPSLIEAAAINDPNTCARIPVKPNAYGRSLQEAVYPFPFRDDQAAVILQELPLFMSFADQISGQNKAQQGQFQKGNKTRHEYADVMANANGRSQMMALQHEAQIFVPLKEILKINILQYQGGTTLFNREKKAEVTIDPVLLRKAVYEFKISDGLIPTDKLINGEAFQTFMQVLGSSPQLASAYDLGSMVSYLAKTQGANVAEFQKPAEQVQYEQAQVSWQQAVVQLAKDNPDIKPEQYPPQPKPEDFGIDPQTGKPLSQEQKLAAGKDPTNAERTVAQMFVDATNGAIGAA